MLEANRRMLFASRPTGMVDAGTVRLDQAPAPKTGPGEALVKVRYLSIDPTIRTWMNDAPGYLPPIGIGDVIRSGGIGKVVESNSDRYRVGHLVLGTVGWQDHAVAGASASEGAGAMQAIPPGLDAPTALTCSASRA